jgi:hypothetical protein
MIRVQFLAGSGSFSLHHHVQTSSGAHPAAYPVGTLGLSPWEQSGQGVNLTICLYLVSRSRMREAILPLPQHVFMAWCLVKHRDNFTFLCACIMCHAEYFCSTNFLMFKVSIGGFQHTTANQCLNSSKRDGFYFTDNI